jgi:hypothetical protein
VQIAAAPPGTPLNELGLTDWRGSLAREWRGFEQRLPLVVQARHAQEGSSALVEVVLVEDEVLHVRLPLRTTGLAPVDEEPGEGAKATKGAKEAESKARARRRRAEVVEEQRGEPLGELAAFEVDPRGNGVFTDRWLLAPLAEVAAAPSPERSVGEQRKARARTLRFEDVGKGDVLTLAPRELERMLRDGELRAQDLRTAVRIDLQLETPAGAPAAGVPVSIALPEPPLRLCAATDASGQLRFALPATARVALAYGGNASPRAEELITIDGPEVRVVRALETGVPLEVELHGGRPDDRAGWTIEAWSTETPAVFENRARSDREGRATLALPGVGPWRLLARRRSAGREIATLVHESAWSGRGVLSLPAPSPSGAGRVRVRFDAAGGHPLPDAEARLWEPIAQQGLALRVDGIPSAAKGPRALLESPELAGGIYVLDAGASGQRWSSFGQVRVPSSGALDLGIVGFRDGASLELDAPEAVRGAEVELVVERSGALVRSLPRVVPVPVRFESAPCTGVLEVRWGAEAAVAPPASGSDAASHVTAASPVGVAAEEADPSSAEGADDRSALESAASRAGARRVERRAVVLAPGRPVRIEHVPAPPAPPAAPR